MPTTKAVAAAAAAAKPWHTSEFWMSILLGAAMVAGAFGFTQATEWVNQFGPIAVGLILQRLLSKTVKGQVPFTAPPAG